MILTLLIGSMMCCAYVIGFLNARQRISDRLFRPWLAAQGQNSGAVYWLRSRDYAAAWRAYDTANIPFLRGRFSEERTFTDAPEYPVVVAFTPAALEAYGRKSHGLSHGSSHVGPE